MHGRGVLWVIMDSFVVFNYFFLFEHNYAFLSSRKSSPPSILYMNMKTETTYAGSPLDFEDQIKNEDSINVLNESIPGIPPLPCC